MGGTPNRPRKQAKSKDNTTNNTPSTSRKLVKLTSDQFTINEQGDLVIKNDEVMEAVKSQLDEGKSPEAGGISVGISI